MAFRIRTCSIGDIIWIAFSLVYDTSDPPEVDEVAFPLPAHVWKSAKEAHAVVTRWFACREYLEFTDARGDPWPFYRGTVRAFATWDALANRRRVDE